MEACVVTKRRESFLRRWLRPGWLRLRRSFTLFADSAAAPGREREKISEQAARMLDAYGDSVLRLAYSYLHNRQDAEEVLQDALVQFLKVAPALDGPEHEKAWLLRVAANLSKNRLRYNAVRRTDELSEELIAQKREDLSFVWEAVKALPEKYRAAVHLFYCEGYSTAQIAKILNRKESTVRSDLARGRERLRTVLREAYEFGV